MPCRATQGEWAMVESADKTWSTGEGNGKPFQCSCLEKPMKSMKRQKDMTLKDELPRTVDNSGKNKGSVTWREAQRASVVCHILFLKLETG